MADEGLINKYRPRDFSEVVGHEVELRAVAAALKKGLTRQFLLTGSSGLGKTTIARLIAKQVGCKPFDLLEIDAATHTGVDEMREVTASLIYQPFGDGVKAVIVDECHMLSRNAWNSMLKVLEEPPPWVYWFLCTTEPKTVPATIVSRCLKLELKPVPVKTLVAFVDEIAELEKVFPPGFKDGRGIVEVCAMEAGGSPRQALANLVAVAAAKTIEEAEQLLAAASQAPPEAIDLARLLSKGARWAEIQAVLSKLDGAKAESIRHMLRAYFTKVLLGARSDKDAKAALLVLDACATPFYAPDGLAPLVRACAHIALR